MLTISPPHMLSQVMSALIFNCAQLALTRTEFMRSRDQGRLKVSQRTSAVMLTSHSNSQKSWIQFTRTNSHLLSQSVKLVSLSVIQVKSSQSVSQLSQSVSRSVSQPASQSVSQSVSQVSRSFSHSNQVSQSSLSVKSVNSVSRVSRSFDQSTQSVNSVSRSVSHSVNMSPSRRSSKSFSQSFEHSQTDQFSRVETSFKSTRRQPIK
jgi:hypothetical protein